MGREKIFMAALGILFMVVMPVWGEAIHDAAEKGDIAKVKSLLAEKSERVSAKNRYGETPLHMAAFRGHKDIVELLIAKGANVNAKEKNSATALHFAAQEGHKDIVELLIAKGADVNAKTIKGQTPLHFAARMATRISSNFSLPKVRMLMPKINGIKLLCILRH